MNAQIDVESQGKADAGFEHQKHLGLHFSSLAALQSPFTSLHLNHLVGPWAPAAVFHGGTPLRLQPSLGHTVATPQALIQAGLPRYFDRMQG